MKDFMILTLSFYLWASTDADPLLKTTKASCIPAQPIINSSGTCFPYLYPDGHCKHILSNTSLFANSWQQGKSEQSLTLFETGRKMLQAYNLKVSKPCLRLFYMAYCPWNFPKCDVTSNKVTGIPLCRETCEYVSKVCAKELEMAKGFNKQQAGSGYSVYWKIINCTHFKYRNGGDNPECYYPREMNSETDKLQNKECYYGNGLGYRGTISTTKSGYVCQEWSSQCPHRHDHPLAEYPELINASNWCRNPGGQAPNAPWCYTSSRSKRWEYCSVKKCPDPAPTKSPDVVQAFSTGPYKIFIEWRPIPLPFVHGTPLGFRIRVSKATVKSEMVNTTSMDTKYFEIKNLEPLTNYSVSVLEFNENGDGPLSPPVYVTTMPQNFVAVKFTVMIRNEIYSSDLSERSSTKFKAMENQVKSKLNDLFQNVQSEKYRLYQIKIIKFFQGSVGVEFDITAELINTTSWSATQSITGRILKDSKSSSSEFKSLLAKASPPPPVNLSQSDITSTSVTISWSAPDYYEPFRITNYTVQYKKSGTKMPYYNAVIVGANKRIVTVQNLDSNTEYLMRVASINAEGSEPSEQIVVNTKGKEKSSKQDAPIAAIVAPIVVMAAVLIGVGILFMRWMRKKKEEEKELRERIERLSENPYESAVDWFDLLKISVIKQWWEIPRDDLTLENVLGSGAFGVVKKGLLKKGIKGKGDDIMQCAVKMLKENPSERELRDLCSEINIMSKIGDHPNVVSLIGACTINGPPLLVVKFAPNGCLLDYLKENRPLPDYENQKTEGIRKVITEKERLKFAHEIAQGMSHLEKHRYVHRDLAARNILLGKDMNAMVSDFGLSRDIYEIGMYENTAGGVLPVRWMAIESLQDYTYNTETDVWSYGVLLWEIENGGIVPYGGLSGIEILEKLKEGYRLEKSPDTSRDLYAIMWKCWNPDPKQRPTFSDLVYQTSGLLSISGGYDEVVMKENHAYDMVEMKNKMNEYDNEAIELRDVYPEENTSVVA